MSILTAPDGYRAWASRYAAETAVSFLEDALVRELRVPTANRALLDAGCGTGRRLEQSDAAFAVGVDLSGAMIAESGGNVRLAIADVRSLPFDDSAFDVVWCRLVIGHVRDVEAVYRETARVCKAGGAVVITDFHPAAAAAGHRRTFRDETGTVREIEHYVHSLEDHAAAARASGLAVVSQREGEVGPAIRRFYDDAGKSDVYHAQLGQRIVLAIAYRKE